LPRLLGAALTDAALGFPQLAGGGNSAGFDGAQLAPAANRIAVGYNSAVVSALAQWAAALVGRSQ